MTSTRARRMNLVALAVLLSALAAFLAFHVLPFHWDGGEIGWKLWNEVWDVLTDPDWTNLPGLIGSATLISGTVLIAAAPFLVPVLRFSRLSWWVAVLASGMVLTGLGGVVVANVYLEGSPESDGPAVPCLLASLVMNFCGLLFIRRESVPQPPAGRGR